MSAFGDSRRAAAFIRDAQAAGLTLTEIRGILAIRDGGQAPCRHVTDLIDQHLVQVEQRLAELAQARDALLALKSRASATDPGDCPEDQVCSILSTSPPFAGGHPALLERGLRAVRGGRHRA